jgi:hypothetical protein
MSLIAIVFLSACQSMPSRGDTFVAVVTRIPDSRKGLQTYPGLSLALQRGVSRQDVTSGRLVKSGCYIDNGKDAIVERRFGFTLLPIGMKVERGEILEIVAEEADGTEQRFGRFYGRYIRKYRSNEADFFTGKTTGKVLRCSDVSSLGEMRVEVYSTTRYWDYDFASAEEARNSEIGDEELVAGRIVISECSPGVDSWAIWKVRVPNDFKVSVGDYIQAIAGSYESSGSVGAISLATSKVAAPRKEDFIRTQGRYTVSCSAPVEALMRK